MSTTKKSKSQMKREAIQRGDTVVISYEGDYSEYEVLRRDGSLLHYVNPQLLKAQGAEKNLAEIKELHCLREDVYNIMRRTKNDDTLEVLDQVCTLIEFKLQNLWGFAESAKFHKFWQRPKCKCPQMDNDERYPTGYYVISGSCLLHGRE